MLNVLETPTTAIGTLFDNVTTVITNILTLFTTVGTKLMSNSLFQLTIGVVVLGIVMSLVFTMVRKLRKRGR
ncbi:MAG TPA: hypothetical protein IAB58_05600 [Candidatus Pelethosoma merdigallinarum]|nr:hypothetical protein [Candidatus Pelethosoma merdigallinarum]